MKQTTPVQQTNGEQSLPEGWLWTSVDRIYDVLGGGTPSTKVTEYWAGEIPWITSADIHDLQDIQPRKGITLEAIQNSATSLVPIGSLIVVTRVSLGKVALTPYPLCFSQDSQGLIEKTEGIISSRFALYYLSEAAKQFKHNSRGTTISGVTKKQLKQLPIPLAPLHEQHRIVAEIETQFIRLDAGIAALKRMQANLKRYKASVLKAACEGRLVPTEAELAQAEGRDYEPAEVLLDRILAERRAKWEVEEWQKLSEKAQKKVAQAKRKAAGRPARLSDLDPSEWQDLPEADYARYLPKNDKWKEKYKVPMGPDTSELPELPEGWVWIAVEQASSRIVDCLHSTPKFIDSGYMCVDTNCIVPGRILLEKARYVDENTFHDRNRRMVPETGDVLFSREGALLGIAVKVPDNVEFCLGQRMMIFRLPSNVDSSYFETFLNSMTFRSQYTKEITGTASPHLNIRDIRRFAFAFPPLAEQHRIVFEVERRLSVVAELEATVEASLKRAERLRQAILKRAFEGKLVPQDPEDEPASVLLERIQLVQK